MAFKNLPKVFCFTIFSFLSLAATAYATSTGMPWEDPLDNLLSSISGPVAKVLGALAIIGFGIGIAFSEGGGGVRKALWVVFGLSLAFSAVSWGLGFLGFSGGILI